ncbi:MAG: maleylpyruvate isomerase family mycothiol-dependent enzyme [Actinophytocola sp.]|uniref:maleylpyruvate isomerase family mycothiol-dependent enzyme n=1 Tax=Actinophytocola sp. TaxID=1872138 RepID=UPI0013275D50|nr:maleylpyruvate isomerase family mycothiol-dependent enzyme [Actinophytocola sp.]MPZ85749.1 maleylpyruvate isomerase family mycothiol-dependent enzyme [Actinophytocola sp.]
MTGSSISSESSVRPDGVPEQRRANERSAVAEAMRCLADVRAVTETLYEAVGELDDGRMHEPSRLPGWSRAHVITHLARNADGFVNLLTWARTGVEHAMYPSTADRDADIEEGAVRLAQVVHEDLRAASDRFAVASDRLSDSQWLATVAGRASMVFPAADIPTMRLFELWVHMIDLDVSVGFDDIPDAQFEGLLGYAVSRLDGRPDGPSVHLTVAMPDGSQRAWDLVGGSDGDVRQVSGSAAPVIAWLTGRGDGADLDGDVPALPAWG